MTRPSAALLVLSVAGCDQVFDLQRPDAPPLACEDLTSHDEDTDGVVDGCDNCPGIANSDQKNVRETDDGAVADAVGDACDPRPRLGGDVIERFHSFAEPAAMDDWDVVTGPWRIDGEAMTFDGPEVTDQAYVVSTAPMIQLPATIEAHVTIRTIKGGAWAIFGVIANADDDGDGSACLVYRPYETPVLKDMLKVFHSDGQADSPLARMMANGDGYRLTFSVESDEMSCNSLEDGGARQGVPADPDDPLRTGTLGLLGQQIDAVVDYVVVYSISSAAARRSRSAP